MTDNERALFAEAIDLWGNQAQVNMLHEEIGELMVAMNKLNRSSATGTDRETARDHALEEIEDVRVMLDQMTVMLDSTEAVQVSLRAAKTARLRQRIDKHRAGQEARDLWKAAMAGGRR